MRLFSLAVFSLSFLSAFANDNPPKARLSEVENIEPKSYRADLTLDPEKSTFSATIGIRMEIGKPLKTIWLNQNGIQIGNADLEAGGDKFTAAVVAGGDDYVGLHFDAELPAGPAALTIHYSAAIREKSTNAIFRQQESGNWYILTQFEATDARGAFPCFDEPSYKTLWQLTLHVPVNDVAISNTPVASESQAGGTKIVVFKETKPLASYLVAFAVGPFEFVDAGTAGRNHAPVRIVVPKGKTGEAKYAAEVTATILTRLEDYFGIPFPYEKSDQVAIPNSAGFGAMENPGMVTYNQANLLADPKVDSTSRQRHYAAEAAHELAHQWFGDLVTTAWWDDIWLNEAFATWMERKLIAEWKPEWDTRVGDVSDKLGAQNTDSLVSVRKIRQEILSKNDISNAFDGIMYQKGASVIGMFESWMGPEEFRKGVQNYLRQYTFRTATAAQFLDALSSSSHKDVTKAFGTFLNQPGVPLVSVVLDCTASQPVLHLEQTRLLPVGSKGSAGQLWDIPICVRYGSGDSGTTQCALMTQPAQDLTLDAATSCPAWVQANDRAVGYYRVEYRGGLLSALTSGNVQARLTAAERVDFVGNARALVNADKLSAGDSMALAESFHSDPQRMVLTAALGLTLGPQNVPENLMPNFQRYLRKNFQDRARALGWTEKPGESDDVRLLRPLLVSLVAVYGGDEELAGEGKALAEKWLADRRAVKPDMITAVLGTAASAGDKSLFDRFLREFKKTQDKQTRGKLMAAMNAFRDPVAIRAGMEAVLTGDVPIIEGMGLLYGGQQEAATRKMALEFLKAHFDEVTAKLPSGGGTDYGARLPRVGASYCDVESRDELKSFLQPRVDKFVGAPRQLDQAIERIDLCIARKAAQAPSVAAFLARY
jgi:alanyl aminopeptidase